MKKALQEKLFVIGLFVLVMVVFSLAERETRKVFEQQNTRNIVELSAKTPGYTADLFQQPLNSRKITRN